MARLLYILTLVPVFSFSQFYMAWNKEFNDLFASPTGIFTDKNRVIFSLSNKAYQFTSGGEQLASFGGGYMMKSYHGKLYFVGGPLLVICSEDGVEQKRMPLLGEDKSEAGAIDASISHGGLYTITNYNFILKYDLNGNYILSSKIGDLATNRFIEGGGNFIYIYSLINQPALGGRLMQYDTLGNQKWSIAPGDVRNILADEIGNCYAAVLSGEDATVIKYDSEGHEKWSSVVAGQIVKGSFKLGDSLFVCGYLSKNGATSNWQRCAYSILSASTGKIIRQEVLDLYKDPNEREFFTQIASDGENIYIGGSHSDENPQCFLIKLSKEGPTGLIEETNNTSFTVFPNPSGSRITISCDNVRSNTLNVTLRNNLGQIVQKKEIECKGQKSWELDLDRHPAGNYTLEILSGKEKVVKKVVVE